MAIIKRTVLLTQDSTTEDSRAPPSDSESFHSATEKLDEQVGPPPSATDESTTLTVHSSVHHSSDGAIEVTTPPQTTPSLNDTLSGMAYNSYRTGS